jgi:hypothetical protein
VFSSRSFLPVAPVKIKMSEPLNENGNTYADMLHDMALSRLFDMYSSETIEKTARVYTREYIENHLDNRLFINYLRLDPEVISEILELDKKYNGDFTMRLLENISDGTSYIGFYHGNSIYHYRVEKKEEYMILVRVHPRNAPNGLPVYTVNDFEEFSRERRAKIHYEHEDEGETIEFADDEGTIVDDETSEGEIDIFGVTKEEIEESKKKCEK